MKDKIYLDYASTSAYKPQAVFSSIYNLHKYCNVNASRGGYERSILLSQEVNSIRKSLCECFGLKEGMAVFTSGCTASLNYAIIGSIKEYTHIISTTMEHNSVLRPLFELKSNEKIDLTLLSPNSNGVITAQMVEEAITSNTSLISVIHTSNVTGATNDIASIGQIAKKHGIRFLVDGAQSVGHTPVNMDEMNIDLLAFPSHKGLMGLSGTGCLLIRNDVTLQPIMFGGTGTMSQSLLQPLELPESLESGTLNYTGIIALGASLKWWQQNRKILSLEQLKVLSYIYDGLINIKGVKIFSQPLNRSGIVSFLIHSLDSNTVADILDKDYNIEVRGGLHCAPLLHSHLNTINTGLIRVSISGFTTFQHAKKLISAVKQIAKKYS